MRLRSFCLILLLSSGICVARSQPTSQSPVPPALSGGDKLLGAYGPYRANNDLLGYKLHVRVDPVKQFLSGSNEIRFRMLEDGRRIQLDLVPTFQIEGIALVNAKGKSTPLTYQRIAGRSLYVDFPRTLHKGQVYAVDFHYSGHPVEMGRFGGLISAKTR